MEFIIVIIGIIIDRITKIWSMNVLSKISEICIINNFCSFYYLENKGAAFGVFKSKLLFLILITTFVLICLICYIILKKPSSKLLRISLSLLISGAIGNLIDRVVYKYVIDFILLHYKDVYYFPVFNIADIMVSLGTFLLLIFILQEGKKEDNNG